MRKKRRVEKEASPRVKKIEDGFWACFGPGGITMVFAPWHLKKTRQGRGQGKDRPK